MKSRNLESPIRSSVFTVVPLGLLFILAISYTTAFLKTGFWADDFMQLGTFYHTFGSFSDTSVTLGRFWANIYWGFATTAFGSVSDSPYIILSTSIFLLSLYFWVKTFWILLTPTLTSWILVFLFASATPFQLMLWSSNSVHTIALLIISIGFFAISKQLSDSSPYNPISRLSILESVTYISFLFANPLYCSYLVIGFVSAVCKIRNLQNCKNMPYKVLYQLYFAILQIILPMLILFIFSIPETLKNSAYQHSSLKYIGKNVTFYKSQLAGTNLQQAIYLGFFLIAALCAMRSLVSRNWLSFAAFFFSFSTLAIVLCQENQHVLNYLVAPLLGILTGFVIELSSFFSLASSYLSQVIATLVSIILFLGVFSGSYSIRQWWIDYNPGHDVLNVRNQIHKLVPSGARICIEENLSFEKKNWFEGGLDGSWGLLHAPVNAESVQFRPPHGCHTEEGVYILQVRPDYRNSFIIYKT